VRRVAVYPSDFGMERMKKEEIMGPRGIWKGGRSKERDEEDVVNKVERYESDSDSDEDDDDAIASDYSAEDGRESDSESNPDEEIDPAAPTGPGRGKIADSDFDPERLRAYEASRLKYYFAVAEFSASSAADAAYREVDGMEVGRSSSNVDLRVVPEDEVGNVIEGREVRDEISGGTVPASYKPPDFVVTALQQTSVKCTWEDGDDLERDRAMKEAWDRALGEDGDDDPRRKGAAAAGDGDGDGAALSKYLALENSSDNGSSSESNSGCSDDDTAGGGGSMRKLLGLEGSDDDDGDGEEGQDEN